MVSPLELIPEIFDVLGLKDVAFLMVTIIFVLSAARIFSRFIGIGVEDIPASTIHNSTVMFSNISISTDSDDDDEWEPEPTPAPAQPFTACPKCGAPRTSHTCEYCKQTLF